MNERTGSQLEFEPDTISVQRIDEQVAVVSVVVEHELSLVETVEDIKYMEDVTPQDHAVLSALIELWHQHRHMGWSREELLELLDDRDENCEGLAQE